MKKLEKEIALENIEKIFNIKELQNKKIDEKVLVSLYTDKEGSDWEYKIHFLSTYVANNYSSSTIKQYLTLFNKSKEIEEHFKKDMYDFNETEMKAFLKLLRAKSYNAITSKYSLLKNYIEIAKTDKKGRVTVPTGMLLKAGDLRETIFTYAEENRYCTRKEIEEGVKKLANPVDQSIFLLLFEGFMGKEYKDLTTLKVSAIDIKNRTIKKEDGKLVKISSFTAQVLEDAIYQTHYYRENSTVKTPLDLTSPYLIKTKLTSTSNGEPLKYTGLTRRLDVLKNRMEMQLLTAKTIYKSGLVERVLIYEHENNVVLNIAEVKSLLREWGELREGADFYKTKRILQEQMLKELEERGFNID